MANDYRPRRRSRILKWRYQIAFTFMAVISSITFGYEIVKIANAPAKALAASPTIATGQEQEISSDQSSTKREVTAPSFSYAAPAPVPEPSSLLLLTLAAPLLLRRQRS